MKCFLTSVSGELAEIVLEDGKPKYIGRGVETNVANSRCSKKQLELTANFNVKTVKVHQTGPNHSGLNGAIIGMGITEKAKQGDRVELLLGEFIYTVNFDEEPEEGADPPPKKLARMFLPRSASVAYKKDDLVSKGSWETIGNNDMVVYVMGESVKYPKPNVAGFDMDGTIITTKSGKVFPKDWDDWKFLYSQQTVAAIQKFFAEYEDFKFVVFTNQAGCKTPKELDGMKKKIETIYNQIGVSVLVFVTPSKTHYRKPLVGGWDLFVKDYNGGIIPDLETSFYCGDAAGRMGKNKDHALSDRLFALNIGISFKLPEQFFLSSNRIPEMAMPAFDPKKYIANSPSNDHINFSHGQEIIIMVGYPGSGKSSFVKSVILSKAYTHVNRDTEKTQAKCLAKADNALQNGESVVVDNTSPEKKDRAEYIKLAKKHKVPVRCFKMNVDHSHALHNNKFRELTNGTNSVPAVAFNTFKSRYQEPAIEEGFTEIVKVNFVPNFDLCEEPERSYRTKLYSLYLLEK